MGVAPEALLAMAFAKHTEVFNLPEEAPAAGTYASAQPYGHLVIDDFFRAPVFAEIQRELIGGGADFNKVFTDELQTRKTISTGNAVPPFISLIAAKFAAAEMLRYLERVTGLRRLIPDPYYNTDYGYYHIVNPGGVLGSHVDHSRHTSLKVAHVLNLVVYLSEGWDPADGGTLCLNAAAQALPVLRVLLCRGSRLRRHRTFPWIDRSRNQPGRVYQLRHVLRRADVAAVQATQLDPPQDPPDLPGQSDSPAHPDERRQEARPPAAIAHGRAPSLPARNRAGSSATAVRRLA
jgi:hypothetical protein